MSFQSSSTPGFLLETALSKTREASLKGALKPILTELQFLEDSGVRFILRVLPERRKAPAFNKKHSRLGEATNPFLPFDPDLFVANLSPTHVCLLNKYNVMDGHLVIVTRRFEHQESPLRLADFEAFRLCLKGFDGLGFYNGGLTAGASQQHKHLQYVPLPLAASGPAVPTEVLLQFQPALPPLVLDSVSDLPFINSFARFDEGQLPTAEQLKLCHDDMQSEINSRGQPYNLLLTRRWILLIPRSSECFGSISVNSLGFAGSLLVKNRQELELLKGLGPFKILQSVAVTRSASESHL